MIVRAFLPDDIKQMRLQPHQEYLKAWLNDTQLAMAAEYPSRTGEVDGVPVASAGILPMWPGRYQAWAYLAADAGKYMTKIHREVYGFLESTDAKRVEAVVDSDFRAGHRWIKLLGFEWEGTMRCYTPDGRDCDRYARVRP